MVWFNPLGAPGVHVHDSEETKYFIVYFLPLLELYQGSSLSLGPLIYLLNQMVSLLLYCVVPSETEENMLQIKNSPGDRGAIEKVLKGMK